MRHTIGGLLALGALATMLPGIAQARPPYQAAFKKQYELKAGGALDKAGCNVCHQGSDKKTRNVYGKDLEKALGKTGASQDEAAAAVKKIETNLSADKKTKYVDLIKADKLPGEEKKEEKK